MSSGKRKFLVKKLIIFTGFLVFCLLLVAFALNDGLFEFKTNNTSSAASFHYLTSSKSETLKDETASQEANKTDCININIATVDELMTLKGIGQTKAEAIIEYRNTNGLFKSTEDIMNVTGIGQSIYNNIKDSITVK